MHPVRDILTFSYYYDMMQLFFPVFVSIIFWERIYESGRRYVIFLHIQSYIHEMLWLFTYAAMTHLSSRKNKQLLEIKIIKKS